MKLYHDSRSLDCRAPFGAVRCGDIVRLRVYCQGRPRAVNAVITLNNQPYTIPLQPDDRDGYELRFAAPATPRLLWYYFAAVMENGQTEYLGNARDGLGGVGETYASAPPSFQLTVYARDYAPPAFLREGVMYQIFPDRFCRSRAPRYTREDIYLHENWDEAPLALFDPRNGDTHSRDFFGGDLQGIISKLDYLQSLHVTVLYLNPIFLARSNHRYDTGDYTRIDPMLGTQADLTRLCEEAAKRGMRVLLDGVFNHCSEHHPFFEDVKRRGKASPYYDFFLIDGNFPSHEKGNYSTFGFSSDMPKLNTGNPAVIDYFCGVGAWWIREFGIDGWRLDVMDEISDDFLRAFRKAVKAANPDALILGEAWHDPRAWLAGDELDGVMNYGLTKALIDYLVDGALTARQAASRLTRLFFRTTSISARMMMNLLDSHDTDRFLTLLRGDRKRLKLALCLLFFFPGMPCVYYGDEIGMTGGYDPDCRKGFVWDEAAWDTALRRHVQLLARLKTGGRLAGDDIRISASGNVLSLKRGELTLLVNASSRAARYCVRGREGKIAANGFVILDADASIIKEE